MFVSFSDKSTFKKSKRGNFQNSQNKPFVEGSFLAIFTRKKDDIRIH